MCVLQLSHSFSVEAIRTGERNCVIFKQTFHLTDFKLKQQEYEQKNCATCSTVHVFTHYTIHILHALPYTFYRIPYECICDRFHHRQCCDSHAGIFKWNFDHFLLETV